MKLLLLGATGATGQALLAQALDAGHHVTALVRSAGKLAAAGDRLLVRIGSPTDPGAVAAAVEGQDAVLSTLGANSPGALLRSDLMTATVDALIPAMERHDVSRVIVLSALGVGQSRPSAPPLLRLVFSTAFRQVGNDKAASEARLSSSGLDWTVVYPPALDNGPRTRDYRAGETLSISGMPKISRADVADFMLAQVGDATYSRMPAIVAP